MGGTHSVVQPDDSLQGSGAVRPSSSFGVVRSAGAEVVYTHVRDVMLVGWTIWQHLVVWVDWTSIPESQTIIWKKSRRERPSRRATC